MNQADGETIPPQDEVYGGPRTPLALSGTSWRNTLKRTGKKYVRDRCAAWPRWRPAWTSLMRCR
jgi:hypothetical protein